MDWIYYSNLTDAAKTALSKGVGLHGKVMVDKLFDRYYIAVSNKTSLHWYLVLTNNNQDIYQIDAIIEYSGYIKTKTGKKKVTFTANAVKASEKRLTVDAITKIDGEEVMRTMDKVEAMRNPYSVDFFAEQEIGRVINISACNILQGNAAVSG